MSTCELAFLWSSVTSLDHEGFGVRCGLYVITDAADRNVAYVGKVDGPTTSVKRRFTAPDKTKLYEWLQEVHDGLDWVHLYVGEPHLVEGSVHERTIDDAESLLISVIRPPGNVRGTSSRASTPGLGITNAGRWGSARYITDHPDLGVMVSDGFNRRLRRMPSHAWLRTAA